MTTDLSDDERRHQIHAGMTSDPQVVADIISQTTEQQPVAAKRIIAGESNEVYDITLADRPNVILRISHSVTDGNFERESWAIQHCQQAGIPVPDIIHQGTFADKGKGLAYMLQRKLPGQTLLALIQENKLSDKELQSLIEQAGEILARIHRIPTTGYGKLDSQGRGEFDTVAAWLDTAGRQPTQLLAAVRNLGFDDQPIITALERLKHLDSPLFQKPPHLTHLDYAPKHILVDQGNITGILDFEFACSSYFGTDVPEWQLRDAEHAPLKHLLTGYKRLCPLPETEQDGQNLCTIFEYVELVRYYALDAPSRHMTRVCLEAIKQLLLA